MGLSSPRTGDSHAEVMVYAARHFLFFCIHISSGKLVGLENQRTARKRFGMYYTHMYHGEAIRNMPNMPMAFHSKN